MLICSLTVRGVAFAAVVMAAGVTSGATGVNLVVNGGVEDGPGGNGSEILAAPGWNTASSATVTRYDIGGGFPTPTDAGPPNRGANFMSGGQNTALSSFSQAIDLSADAALIDSGSASCTISAYIGGFSSQNDHVDAFAEFDDHSPPVALPTVLAGDRTNLTGMLARSANAPVPAGVRSVTITVSFVRTDGSYNDGYADEISFILNPPPTCIGDINHDGFINTLDLTALLSKFGQSVVPGTPADINGDGSVNTLDLTQLLARFGQTCS